MSICIIKYTYTRYVGVDIEKYTRGLFDLNSATLL